MNSNNEKKIKIIDKLIFGFVVLFLLSLNNSIFVNQIGYYGALLLFLIRYAVSRKNPFEKTGLEIPFLLFLLAELISAILSVNTSNAFRNFFHRFLLIPTFYVMIAAVNKPEKAKLFVKIYLGAALLTIMVYAGFAYEYLIHQLYQIESKGPSVFQYVMTAGGLISFTTIFFFAFLVNEKTTKKVKVFLILSFLISLVALLSSYTRAAWLGAATGIFVVLLLKKKWVIIGAFASILIAYLLLNPNESKIYIYNIANGNLAEKTEINTGGRASYISTDSTYYLLADFQDGIKLMKNKRIISHLNTPSPAAFVGLWKNNIYLSMLTDMRFFVFEKDSSNQLKKINEFVSRGNTRGFRLYHNRLYVDDIDSGMTVFLDPFNSSQKVELPNLNGITHFDINNKYFAAYSPNEKVLKIYTVKNFLPNVLIYEKKINTHRGFMRVHKSTVYFIDNHNFNIIKIKNNKVKSWQNITELSDCRYFQFTPNGFYTLSLRDILYKVKTDSSGNFIIQHKWKLSGYPSSFEVTGNKLFITYFKRNRIASIVDPFHVTNMERLQQWATGLRIFKAHPIFGVGDIDLQKTYSKYKRYYERENYGHLHNNYVQFLVILGAFGFIIVLYLLVKIFLLNVKIYKHLKNIKFADSYALGTLAAFCGFLVSGLAEWNFGDHEIITMVWFTLGLNYAFYKFYFKRKEIDKASQ